jgi:diguanylate cyclase (GGDEF)-like protein
VTGAQRAGATAAAATAAAAAAVDRRVLLVLALLSLLATVVRALLRRPDAASRWGRGWGLVAVAVVPAAGSLVARGPLWSPGLLAAAAALVLAGALGALPSREATRARELAVEAALGGGVTAYLVGAFVPSASGPELAALALGVSSWWLLALLVLREPEQVTAAARWLAAGLAGVIVVHTVDSLLTVGGLAEALVAAPAGAGVLAWAVACSRPELHDHVPPALPPVELLHAGHVRVVVAGVLAGPFAVVVSWVVRPDRDLLPLVSAGGTLALIAVLHLLQLVNDHGQRAWQARHDALTGLPSEPLFHERLERAMARGARSGTGFTVAFVDLDGFKRVNDRDGHDAGDRVLCTVAERLRAAVRAEDTVARRSGDEFLLLLEGLERRADAELLATQLLAALAAPVGEPGREHRLAASVGLVRWPHDGLGADELLRDADAAMYDAKRRGPGTVRWYAPDATARSRLRLGLARQLEVALAVGEQLELAFQPRVDLRDGRLVELVALVRWRHPELGLLLPGSFVPLADEAGLAPELDLAVLELAGSTVQRWVEAGLADLPLLVHVADASLAHPSFEEDVVQVLRRTGLHAPRLGLAVTESAITSAGARGARTIADLAELGVRVTVARFGTGPAGVGALAAVPLDTLELSASVVSRLGDGGPLPRVLGAALAVAERLELVATASGVASAEQAERLRAAGCATARGPHLGSPVLASTLGSRLVERGAAGSGRPLLAQEFFGDALPGAEDRQVAAVLAGTRTHDDVDGVALAEVLARLEPRTSGGSPDDRTPTGVRRRRRRPAVPHPPP